MMSLAGTSPNLSLYFESGVSYSNADMTLMLVSCPHCLWRGRGEHARGGGVWQLV
jgi:hypothetical protein